MKKLTTLLAMILLFANCSKNDEETSNPVIGEWKLIKVEQNDGANNISITDYTNQNIIYKFETNSNLNVNINNVVYNSGDDTYTITPKNSSDNFKVDTPITGLVYTPATNRDGDVKFEVSVQNKEGDSIELTSKGETTIEINPVIDMKQIGRAHV